MKKLRRLGLTRFPPFFLQLYAEPSMIHYIRNNIDVKNCIIVSPDAGGAKRSVRLSLFDSIFLRDPKLTSSLNFICLTGPLLSLIV